MGYLLGAAKKRKQTLQPYRQQSTDRQTIGNILGFLCLHANMDPQTRLVQHLLVYAVYSATNQLRRTEPASQAQNARELLLQFVHQGAGSCTSAQAAVQQHLFHGYSKRRRLMANIG